MAVPLIAYFDKNIVSNHNADNPAHGYANHILADEEMNAEIYEKWRKMKKPDVIIGDAQMQLVFDDFSYADYDLVLRGVSRMIWKGSLDFSVVEVYIKKGLLEQE